MVNPEIIGRSRETILVPKEAEFYTDQRIQNPLKSFSGNLSYMYLKIWAWYTVAFREWKSTAMLCRACTNSRAQEYAESAEFPCQYSLEINRATCHGLANNFCSHHVLYSHQTSQLSLFGSETQDFECNLKISLQSHQISLFHKNISRFQAKSQDFSLQPQILTINSLYTFNLT